MNTILIKSLFFCLEMNQTQRVAYYAEDKADENEPSSSPAPMASTQSSKKYIQWVPVANFETKQDAYEKMTSLGSWIRRYANDTTEGVRVHYRCNLTKRKSHACPVRMYLLIHSDDTSVSLFSNDEDHVHSHLSTSAIADR